MKVLAADEMRAIEQDAVAHATRLESLMLIAGTRVADAVRARGAGTVLILAGPGNNGGDALVAAEALRADGVDVAVHAFHRNSMHPYTGAAVSSEDDPSHVELGTQAGRADVVVDGLLGIGQTRPVEGELAAIVRTVEDRRGSHTHRLSIDIPTGVDSDTGGALGEAFQADATVCMGFLKVGLLLYPGAAYAGHVDVVDVGIPRSLADSVPVSTPSALDIARILPRRQADSNKGSAGRVVYAGGSRDFLGAPALCSMAAYRAGAGLVELAVIPLVQQAVAAHNLEPIFTLLAETGGQISPDAADAIASIWGRAQAFVFGPGMGLSDDTVELTRALLRGLPESGLRGTVIDADGLNALSRIDDWWKVDADIVLTPHPGEMSRLTGESIATIQSNRLASARSFAQRWRKVVVLKGAATVIAAPDGRAVINPTGGPNLATAGTGDVLAGIIGGLIAQGRSPFEAATAGVYLHGYAGDRLRETLGDAGTVASDLLSEIPRARAAVQFGA